MPRSRDELLQNLRDNVTDIVRYEPNVAAQNQAIMQLTLGEILLDIRDSLSELKAEQHETE